MLAPTLPLRRQGRVDPGSVSLPSLEFTSSLAIALSYSVQGKTSTGTELLCSVLRGYHFSRF